MIAFIGALAIHLVLVNSNSVHETDLGPLPANHEKPVVLTPNYILIRNFQPGKCIRKVPTELAKLLLKSGDCFLPSWGLSVVRAPGVGAWPQAIHG